MLTNIDYALRSCAACGLSCEGRGVRLPLRCCAAVRSCESSVPVAHRYLFSVCTTVSYTEYHRYWPYDGTTAGGARLRRCAALGAAGRAGAGGGAYRSGSVPPYALYFNKK